MARRRRHSPEASGARFLNDPFRTLANWATRKYALGRTRIRFVPGHHGLGFAGRTSFHPGHAPYIELNASTNMDELLGILAHEFAHVMQYRRRRPGKNWGRHDAGFRKLLENIEADWIARCNRREQRKRRR